MHVSKGNNGTKIVNIYAYVTKYVYFRLKFSGSQTVYRQKKKSKKRFWNQIFRNQLS